MRKFPGTAERQPAQTANERKPLHDKSMEKPKAPSGSVVQAEPSDPLGNDVLDADYDDGTFVEGDSIYYSTGEVAQRLGISRDMTRKHMQDFEEFLNITYSHSQGKYKHMRLLSTDIELLERIVRLRQNKHSIENVKEFLRDPDFSFALNAPNADITGILSEVLTRNNTALLDEVKKIVDQGTAQNLRLIEANSEKDQRIVELSTEVQDLKALISKQNDEMKTQTQAIADLKSTLDEQAAATAKKKGFFGLFK